MARKLWAEIFTAKSARNTLGAFLLMLACLEVTAAINAYVLAASGATSGAFKYLGREIYLSLALLLPVLLPFRLSRVYSVLLYLAAAGFAALNWVHYFFYNSPVSSYLYSVLNETYTTEVYEFTVQFISSGAVFRIACAFVLPLPFLALSLRRKKRAPATALVLALIICSFIGLRLADKGFSTVVRWNYVADFIWSGAETMQAGREFNTALNQQGALPDGITKQGATGRVVVLVIGEASSRHHYSLYGYPRPTTPGLEELREKLLVFTDVVSAHAHTIPALREGLTIADRDNAALRYTLVDLLKAGGYHVVVLSNQPPLGMHETAATQLLGRADELHYFNTSNTNGMYTSAFPDEILLPAFEDSLQHSGDLAIIVHLMGSHSAYDLRVPKAMPHFTGLPPYAQGQNLDDAQIETINDYDTSIAYTDKLLTQLLDDLERLKRPAALLYASDHGEAVYEDGQTRGHAENSGCRYMYEIPFLVWLSPEYQQELPGFSQSARDYVQRPWQSGNLAYPVLRLAGVSFNGLDARRDILAQEFIPQPRSVGGKDYDALYSEPKQLGRF